VPSSHNVLPTKQEKADREQATNFVDSIVEGTPLASKGDVSDKTSGGEPLWLSIAKGKKEIASEKFKAAGGTSAAGTRTIAEGWAYVDIQWLNKIKTDAEGNVHYEAWSQPLEEQTTLAAPLEEKLKDVLTKPKIICVAIEWLRVDKEGDRKRYVLGAADYQRLVDAVK